MPQLVVLRLGKASSKDKKYAAQVGAEVERKPVILTNRHLMVDATKAGQSPYNKNNMTDECWKV